MPSITALPAAMRYILKAESYDRRGAKGKLYCIIAGSAVLVGLKIPNAENYTFTAISLILTQAKRDT